MKPADRQGRISQAIQHLSTQLLDLAASSWQRFKEQPEVAQEIAKDPFTSDEKEQAVTAELLIFLLHACDRVASATFSAALSSTQRASALRTSFMSALVGVTIPAFAQLACPEEETEEQAETQADLLYLYNTRAMQYGFFSLGAERTANDQEALFTLAGIRIAEALDCPGNAVVIGHSTDTILASLTTLREQLPLKNTIAELIAGAQ